MWNPRKFYCTQKHIRSLNRKGKEKNRKEGRKEALQVIKEDTPNKASE